MVGTLKREPGILRRPYTLPTIGWWSLVFLVFGSWADRSGPARPLLTAIGLFGVGLVLAGSAPAMTAFVAGRVA
jgi:MFS family permease